eukprot:3318_1
MPYHKQKYASKDYVMCNCCKKRLMRQNVDSHYETFNKTKDGIIEHDTHVGLRYCELTDPSDVTSASIPSIKVRGLSSYFATKSKPNDTDDRHDDTTVTAPKASHKPELCEPKPQTKPRQHPRTTPMFTIIDMFQKVADESMEINKLGFDVKYFMEQMNGNIADNQYPKNCLKNHRIHEGCMGQIGISTKAPPKLREFMANQIQSDIGESIVTPTPATLRGLPFSGSWDKARINRNNYEPGIIKKRVVGGGYYEICPVKLNLIDHKEYFGNGESLALNKMECLLVWMALPLLEARRYCTSICTDRQYMDLKVDVLLDRFMNWPSLFQFINDLCHQYELALDVPLRNNIFEWTHNELTKTVLHPLAYGSNRYLELKNLMGKSFKTIRSIKEVKFHSHKRKNYEAMDNNCISLRHCYLQTMKAHPPRNISKPSKDYKQWKLQASILSSLHYNCMNKLAVSIYEFIDTISQQYQSPNHPWHNMRKDTDDVAVFYMMITNVFRNYMDELDSMDNEQFMQRTHLFNAQILALFPDLKSLYIQGDGVFVDGPLDRIFAVYHKKKYKNDKEKEQYESKRDELLQIHTGVELQITAIQKLCVAYCYVCGEKNWNSIQIECVSCRHMVHIKCVDPMNNKDAAWYKEQNINYVCPRHALDDNEDDQDDNEQHDLNLQCECTVGSLARQSLTLSSNETYTCDGCQTALIEGSIVYDCEECGFGMCEECLVLLRSENHAESTAIEDRNADLLNPDQVVTKLEDLFIGLYDSNGLEIVECDALTITKLVVKSMVKSSELIVSGLHFCLRYPSWIDEIHSILDFNMWFDLCADLVYYGRLLTKQSAALSDHSLCMDPQRLYKELQLQLTERSDEVDQNMTRTMELFISLYESYLAHGVKELEELMGYWVNDDALQTHNISESDALTQYLAIKLRLFLMFSNDTFDLLQNKLQHHFNTIKRMQYKWRPYNTFLWILFEEPTMYNGCDGIIFVIDYLSSMGCPEPNLESAFSVLKCLLNNKYNLEVENLNAIFLIRYYLKDECSEETLLFLTKLAEDYLSSHRSPLTTHRSKYGIHGEVLTKLMRSADAKVDLTELVAQLHALKSINITDLNNNSDEDIDVEMDVSLNDEEMYDEGVMHDESVLHDGNTAGLNIEMDLSESEHSEEEKHDILDDDL